jgi:cell division FtsZ-interacting protein ZapD
VISSLMLVVECYTRGRSRLGALIRSEKFIVLFRCLTVFVLPRGACCLDSFILSALLQQPGGGDNPT